MKTVRTVWNALTLTSLLYTSFLHVKDVVEPSYYNVPQKIQKKESKKTYIKLLKKTFDYTIYAVGVGTITYVIYCYCNKKEINVEMLQTEFIEQIVQQADRNGTVWATELPGFGKIVVIPAWIINAGHIGNNALKALIKPLQESNELLEKTLQTVRQAAHDKLKVAVQYLKQASTDLKETGNHCCKLANESVGASSQYVSHGLKTMAEAAYTVSADLKGKAQELL